MIIGIVHHDSTKKFLPALLKSLKGVQYPVQIVYNNKVADTTKEIDGIPIVYNMWGGFELGALKRLMEANPKENDFFILQESVVIKDHMMFGVAASYIGSLACSHGFMHFMGKYQRDVVNQIGIPVPQTRLAEIYWEYFWNIVYINAAGDKIATFDEPLLDNSEVFEQKFGRKNMVLENKYMKKWKSNWGGVNIKTPPQDFIPK